MQVKDQSALHEGHAGAAPGGETHFAVTLVSEAFRGMTRLQRQRAVMAAVADEFEGGLHALTVKASAPES